MIGSFQENVSLYKKEYFVELKNLAIGHKVFFHANMPHREVLRFLDESKIYWHARGYEEENPNEYENFGITTVEAMAAGCVPIVIGLGAQPEIVDDGVNGFVWNKPEELIKHTENLIKNKRLMNKLSNAAIKKSKKYSSGIFERKILKVVDDVMKQQKN